MQSYKNEQPQLSWDDVRVVMAVAKTGTLMRAAALLKCSHPTVFRRVQAIEQVLGARLFERGRQGYLATDAADELLQLAQRFEADLGRIELKMHGRDERPSGDVSLTTSDTFMQALLPAPLATVATALPDIRLQVTVSDHLLNLGRREADIALRSGGTPPDNLVGRKISGLAVSLYRPKHWTEVDMDSLDRYSWVMPDDSFSHLASSNWLAAQGLQGNAVIRCSSMLAVASMSAAGAGLAILPCYIGDASPALRRVCPPRPAFQSDLWLLSHPDTRKIKRISAVIEHLIHALKAEQDLLEGRRPYVCDEV